MQAFREGIIAKHNLLTAGALSVLAFVAADLSHELLGHGSVAYLEHANQIQLSYTALSTDITSKALLLAGPLINLILGGIAFFGLRWRRFTAATEWFLFLFASMSLLNFGSYMILSGMTNTGDLAGVWAGSPHILLIRWLMDLLGLSSYIAAIPILGRIFNRFAAPGLLVCVVAHATPIVLNSLAAMLSPLGLHYYLLSALPATAGINIYLFFMPRYAHEQSSHSERQVVPQNLPVTLLAFAVAISYAVVLGPGNETPLMKIPRSGQYMLKDELFCCFS